MIIKRNGPGLTIGIVMTVVRCLLVVFVAAGFGVGALHCCGVVVLVMRDAMHRVHDA